MEGNDAARCQCSELWLRARHVRGRAVHLGIVDVGDNDLVPPLAGEDGIKCEPDTQLESPAAAEEAISYMYTLQG